jgi:GDP-L-fucose synthase
MTPSSKIFIAGHRGMVGSAIHRLLVARGFTSLLTRTHAELDLCNSAAVESFFQSERPDYVILAAAKVGGIKANSDFPADFLYDNLAIQTNVIHQAWQVGVKKLCFLGSSCIYPRECPQPMREEYLLTGPLEPTNEAYAVAKIAGYKMALAYSQQHGFPTISLMPCNLYGPNDCYDLERSHVFPALIRRFVEATDKDIDTVTLWGTGIARREFMHVDDLAHAVLHFMSTHNDPKIINIGTGEDLTIRELADKIATSAEFHGRIDWDSSQPDGMLRKCLDVSRMRALGFETKISLDQGIAETVREFRSGIRAAKGERCNNE